MNFTTYPAQDGLFRLVVAHLEAIVEEVVKAHYKHEGVRHISFIRDREPKFEVAQLFTTTLIDINAPLEADFS